MSNAILATQQKLAEVGTLTLMLAIALIKKIGIGGHSHFFACYCTDNKIGRGGHSHFVARYCTDNKIGRGGHSHFFAHF